MTFAGEAGVLSGDFAPDVVLMVSIHAGHPYDPPNEDNPIMRSSPGRLLPHNTASEFVESDLVRFHKRYGLPNSAWLRLPLNGEKVDWSIPR